MRSGFVILGSLLVGVGIAFLFHNFDVVHIQQGWPLILVAAGAGIFIADRGDPSGIILAVLGGAAFVISKVEMWDKLWPVVLVLVGVAVAVRHYFLSQRDNK